MEKGLDMVEYEQQPQATPQATPQTLAPPMPPSDPVEETKQQEGVVIRGTATAEATPTAVAALRSRTRKKERAAGRRNNRIRGITAAASGNCNAG